MCRSITALRGLEPPATSEEIEEAARQFLRKVGALSASQMERPEVERALAEVAASVRVMIEDLPARRQPPRTVPPLRLKRPAGG